MAQFILIHTRAIEEVAQDTTFKLFHALVKVQVPGTKWLGSWMAVDASRLFCLWEAPDEEHIHTALGPERLAMLPIQAAYEVVAIDPAFFA